MSKSKGLGRGLGSLIPMKKEIEEIAVPKSGIREVKVFDITENPHQPRRHFSPSDLEDLLASIKEHGLLQPLVVTEKGNGYELIAGERRLRAARTLGLQKVPVIVRTATEQEKLELALIENIQRQDLNSIEEAVAYQALIDQFGLTQNGVAKRVGKSRPAVANIIRLLELNKEMRQAIVEGKITKSHARTLLAESDHAKREQLFHSMLNGGLTVREAESKISSSATKARKKTKDPNIADHEKKLREILGTKVEIQDKKGKGKLVIHYYSEEELLDLLNRLTD